MNAETTRGRRMSIVGPYLLLQTISNESSSKVRLAVHQTTGQQYACKVIEKHSLPHGDTTPHICHQVIRANILPNHPNVTTIKAVYSTSHQIYILMELITGPVLVEEVNKYACLTEPYARFLLRQLVDAVSFCHRKGVYDLRLKPANIMLTEHHVIKILHSALAQKKKSHQPTDHAVAYALQSGSGYGNPNYIAPEILLAKFERCWGISADAWSIGIILYVMVSGTFPFDSAESENPFKPMRHKFRCPDYFSPEFKDLIVNIFAQDPKQRLSIHGIRHHPWLKGPTTRSMQPWTTPANTIRVATKISSSSPASDDEIYTVDVPHSDVEEEYIQDAADDDDAEFVSSHLLGFPLDFDERTDRFNVPSSAESLRAGRTSNIPHRLVAGMITSQSDVDFQDDLSDSASSSGLSYEGNFQNPHGTSATRFGTQLSNQHTPMYRAQYDPPNDEHEQDKCRRKRNEVSTQVRTRKKMEKGTQVYTFDEEPTHSRMTSLHQQHCITNSVPQARPGFTLALKGRTRVRSSQIRSTQEHPPSASNTRREARVIPTRYDQRLEVCQSQTRVAVSRGLHRSLECRGNHLRRHRTQDGGRGEGTNA